MPPPFCLIPPSAFLSKVQARMDTPGSSDSASRLQNTEYTEHLTNPPTSWSFDQSAPIPEPSLPRAIPRSIFSPTISPSRFTSPLPSSTVPTPEPLRHTSAAEQSRTPPPALATLDPPLTPEDWQHLHLEDDGVRAMVNRRRLPRVEKDVDDPTEPDSPRAGRASLNRAQSTTLTTLSRLFAAQAGTSPTDSRTASYNQQFSLNNKRSMYTARCCYDGPD